MEVRMRTVNIKDLGCENFNPILINALRQYWKNTKYFQCVGAPKKQNLLLFLDGCKITYTDKNGDTFTAESGDVVYTPIGSEYKASLHDFRSDTSHTVGINFLLTDESALPLKLSDKIEIFHVRDTSEISTLFERCAVIDMGRTEISTRVFLLKILSLLATSSANRESSVVSGALSYLSAHIEENPSVKTLAKICNVSEVYLRRKFKECMGCSPVEYRNKLRLDKAISYLKFGDISIQEISDTLGYSTVSHFIKEFKRHVGISPLQYKKAKLR